MVDVEALVEAVMGDLRVVLVLQVDLCRGQGTFRGRKGRLDDDDDDDDDSSGFRLSVELGANWLEL